MMGSLAIPCKWWTLWPVIGLLLQIGPLPAKAAKDDWAFANVKDKYSGTINECSIACEKLYVSTPKKMGIRMPAPDKVESIKFRIAKSSRDAISFNQFKAEGLLVGDFAFLFIRTKTDGSTNLNRESRAYYSMDVRAIIILKSGETISTSTRVDVTILDVNDGTPLFAKLSYTMNVPESADIFSTIGSVRATDADEGANAEIYYSFLNWLPEFAVHPTSGDVYVTRNLTLSGEKVYKNYVVADNRGHGRRTKVPITFNIVLQNDHSPQFILMDRPPVNAFTPVGLTIMVFKVIDADMGLNGEIQAVEIVSALSSLNRDLRDHFKLVRKRQTLSQAPSNDYQLQVHRTLRGIGEQVNLTVQAWDKGNPERSGKVTIPLQIVSTSGRDSGVAAGTVQLEISEGLPAGTPLHYIAPPHDAIDATYNIVNDELDSFRVDSISGVLFLKRRVDAERNYKTSLEVRLRAKFNRLERVDYFINFVITIADENDNSPVFRTPIEKPLAEASKIGTVVTIATATDDDAGDNSLITYSIAGTNRLPFGIDPLSGEIRLTGTLDYDKGLRLYHIPVRASDRGSPYRRQTEKIFTVKVENVNDNKPMFERDKCTVFIAKGLIAGSRVSKVTALDIDRDLRPLTYFIRSAGSTEPLLDIGAQSGIVTTNRDLSGLLGSTLKHYITASDGVNVGDAMEYNVEVLDYLSGNVRVVCTYTQAKRIYEEAVRASAKLNPAQEEITLSASNYQSNDHSPVFDHQFVTASTQYSLPEDLAVGSIVTHVTASDQDSGYAGLVQYYISKGNTRGHFAINGSTGALIVFAALDREQISTYRLTVVAQDCADKNRKRSSLDISLTILDANDNTPKFLSDTFEAYINETAARGTFVIRVMARDDDIDDNGKVKYSLITDTPYFSINSATGVIAVKGVLDRESKDRHILEVKAADTPVGPEEIRFATTTVIIHITDVNDNPPVFMKSEFRVKVREDMPVGTVITNLVAQDADLPASGGAVAYRIIKGVEDLFYVDKATGVVKLMSKLDYEFKNIYKLTVRARDNGTLPLRATCLLVVEVIDVNENLYKPVFDKLVYSGSVNETASVGSKVIQVKATDADVAVPDHRLTYTIRKGSGLGIFSIDNSGLIRTARTLDRETQSSYWLTIYAQDSGSVPLSSSVEVYVKLNDANDNAPEASQPVFYVSVSENSPSGIQIAAIKATDKDYVSDISYSITGGNTQSLFKIESRTGIIRTTRRTLDRESGAKHTLEVTISDGGDAKSALSSSVQVWVTITDENDNVPTWNTDGKRTVKLFRSHNKNVPVHRVTASDLDAGENGSVSYSLPERRDRALWKIDSVTGELYLIASWPKANRMIVKVKATDGGLAPKTNSLDIEFVLVNALSTESGSPPVFQSVNPVYLPETMPVFELVEVVTALDPDSSNIWYSIVDGSECKGFPMFSIQSGTGIVEIAAKLDFETKSHYALNISATDGFHTVYTILPVTLTNVNEFQPRFSQRVYEVKVKENIKIGSEILQLTATDKDHTDILVYLLHSASSSNSYSMFGVDHNTGVVSTLRALDHETNRVHELIVKVNDNGIKEYTDHAKVIVHILDHNDHAPTFVTDIVNVRVYEMSVIGTAVTEVQAIDPDKGDNSRIQYSLLSGNVGYTFKIDPDLGTITLARTLDLSVRSRYELTIMANDMGVPSLSATCLVKVWVTVADERAPSFDTTFFTTELPENKPAGTFVIALSGESQSTLTYTVVNEKDTKDFSVNPNSGILTSRRSFDYEEKAMYNITLRATDIVDHQVTLTVVVHIIDRNDNRPTFKQSTYRGHVSEGSPDGAVILTDSSVPLILTATDKDSNLNALLLYSIVESEAKKYFLVDPNTGAIRTSLTPDRETRSTFEFSVQVRDQAPFHETGEESLSAADPARVIITIDDINDTPPRFSQSVYEVKILVPTYQGVIVHAMTAYDPDLDSDLKYTIASGNAGNAFAIKEKSGMIYVQTPSSLRRSHILVVKVADGVHDAVYNLTVKVQETSDSKLMFSKSVYSGKLVENKTSSQSIEVVMPLGLELGEPVTFELLNYRELFLIGRTSGVLETRGGAVIDREAKDEYEVIVRVQTHGHIKRLAQVRVIVTVTDINDNAPYFTRDHYYATATVTSRRFAVIAKLLALDDDEGNNKQLRYGMSGPQQNLFKLSRKTGELSVKKPLTESANREFVFTVTAYDQGEPSLSTQVLLTVKVYAASTPNFTHVVYESSIPENIPISSAVTTVSATSPNSNKIIYTIVDGDPNNEFTVHFSTAMNYNGPCTVRVNDDLDFDVRPRYRLKVRAVDVVTGDWSDALVIINVQDVNDQKPFFGQLDYYKTVSEAVTIGSEIISLNASDADQGINSQIHYSLRAINESRPHHLLFKIKDDGAGVAKIHTVAALDHETNDWLEFIIVAADGGNPRLSSQAYIHIELTDLNDNPPIFEQSVYSVEISDEVKKGQFLAMVSAVDADETNEGELMYNIVHGNDGQAFTINQHSGSVYVSPFHQSTMFTDLYALNISVTDGIFTSFTSLKVTVKPANRHTPEFPSLLYNFKVLENSTVGTVLGQVKATDKDVGEFRKITYSLIGDWLHAYFRIHPTTGDITLKHKLDREQRNFYMLPIMAQDSGGRTEFTSVYIVVEDVNDHSPEFLASGYTAALSSNATTNTEVLTVSAFDIDKQKNAKLVYSILSDTAAITRTFMINADSGKISLIRNLDVNDRDKEITFFVKVSDSGNPVLDSSALITVVVTSRPPPVFRTRSLQVFPQETEKVDSVVAKVQAEYSGEHKLSYRIRAGSSVRTNKPASYVVDSEGQISTITSLDAENQNVYELVVEAYTRSVPELVDTILVTVSPIDSNDNPPQFTSDVYTISIAENVPIGSSILQVSAFDTDQDHETGVAYSFALESLSFRNLFMIEPNHGWITSLVPLDREQQATYEFYIQASDMDKRGPLTSKAKVVVNLLDANDCPPRFPHPKIIGGVAYWNGTTAAVNEDAPVGTIVVKVYAVDDDLPQHSTKMYYISGGNDQGHFRIKQTGDIFVSKSLDRETINEYHLEISATDGVFVSSIFVLITILDANDNPPICGLPIRTKVLSEDVDVGTLVLGMKASDRDESRTLNSRISYSLRGERATDFAIDDVRGDIRVYRKLDREKVSVYHITGVATDGKGLQCTTDIEFELLDVNDNSPVFDQSTYVYALPEDSANNTLLLRVTATDKDAGLNRKVDYSLHSGATDMFAIDASNGIVRLIKPVRVERVKGQPAPSYTVVIAATDRGTTRRTGTAKLLVHISDVNDPPAFQSSLYNKSVSENVAVGTRLLRVKARSTDTGRNDVIKYRISNGGANNQLFAIDPVTGMLSTAGVFDYELVREYVLNIEAKDEGDPPLSDMCMVTVYITDSNDNKPTFSQATYSASVREDAKIGDQVIRIEAQDLDSGPNADIIYSIVAGDDLDQFSIDKERGYLSVAAPLDREAIEVYRVTLQAADKGAPVRQTSQVLIIIAITDINDNAPVFSRTNYTAQVQVYPEGALYRNTTFLITTTTHSPPTSAVISPGNTNTSPKEGDGGGYSPLSLSVTDADDTTNSGPFKYKILSGDVRNQFSIADNGQLLARGVFDMKVQKEYLLKVRVEDAGVPPLSATTYVRLMVHEAVLHPPRLVSPRNFTVVAYEDTFPGGVIGHVKATDPDLDTLEYQLASPHYRRMFRLHSKSGALSSYSLDSGTYVLNVSAADGRFTRYGVIEVKVVSITDEMMADSVAVRIAKITAVEFVSLHRRSFERALLGLSTGYRLVHTLSITDGSTSSGSRVKRASSDGVLVLVAVETSTGDMISRATLTSAIRDNENTVESIIGGLEISLPADNFVCPATLKCNADERCELHYQISQDKVTIHTEQQSFVSLVAEPVDRCVCLGDKCINPCSTSPCPRHKQCVVGSSPRTYSCQCPVGTFGVDCDVHDGSPIAFSGASYARWTLANDIKTKLHVKLTFRTKQADAVLMDARGARDYSTLEIVNGVLQYKFECGSGPASARTKQTVNDGHWHNVTLERKGNFAQLVLDSQTPSQAESDRSTEEINLLDNNVYFGATVITLNSGAESIQAGFKGCMKDIQIDKVTLPYTGSNAAGSDAKLVDILYECREYFYGECIMNPCLNGGTCLELSSGVFCGCAKGHYGSRCEKDRNECEMDNTCSAGSTCENTWGSFTCHCPHGKAGLTCSQKDMCLAKPCADNSRCVNLDASLGKGNYTCQCADGQTGAQCDADLGRRTDDRNSLVQILCAVGGGLGLAILIIVIAVVARCVVLKKRRTKKMVESQQSERDLYYPRGSHTRHSEDSYHHRAPSPAPPSVPPRPASYTPSVNENCSKVLHKNYELSHDYGSAADGLDRLGHIFPSHPPRSTSTFAALTKPKLTPPPPSVSDTDSIKKPHWDFDYPTNEHASGKDISSGKGSDRPSRTTVIAASKAGAKAGGSKPGSRTGSKPASITNGSFTSIPQEDEVSLASLHGRPALSAKGRASHAPLRNVAKGYHWDTSDWAMVREDGLMMDRQTDRNGYPVAARLLSMSEVDDSEYVEDSEQDDDVIPAIGEPSYNADDILALQAQFKLEYDVPEIHVPKPNRNHYLPSHGISPAEKRKMTDVTQPLLAQGLAHGPGLPAVPQRSASLSYSTDDIACATADEMAALEGYTSMEAGDSQSEMSENICEIESDCEADMEGILSRVKSKHRDPHSSDV